MNDIESYDAIPFADELFPIRILWHKKLIGNDHAGAADRPEGGTWHEQLEIIYFLEGRASVKCGVRRYLCGKGDIIIINPCELHEIDSVDGAAYYHCFMIDPRLYNSGENDICSLKYLSLLSNRRLAFNNRISDNRRARAILEQFIVECEEADTAYEIAVKGFILLLLSELIRHELQLVAAPDDARCNARGYEQIEPALRIISSSYTREIRLGELADACHLAPSYFCRRFREVMGRTATDYITEYRIAKAETLLLTTDLSISQVSQRSGFSDSGYFSRIFRTQRGVSPSALRSMKEASADSDKSPSEIN